MSATRPALTDQHLYLRMLIMLMGLVGNLNASLRQLLLQMGLFLLFSLLDIHSFARLGRALRLILAFLAAYWLFATLLGTSFPIMLLFSVRLIFFAQLSVYTFSHLKLSRVLHDCQSLTRFAWGRDLLIYLSATLMFIQSFRNHWTSGATGRQSSLAELFMHASKASLAEGESISASLESAVSDPASYRDARPASGLIGLALLSLMVLLGAV